MRQCRIYSEIGRIYGALGYQRVGRNSEYRFIQEEI